MSSSLPPFTKDPPKFESQIPSYLLADTTAKERWEMELLSILKQQTEWQTSELVRQSETIARVEYQVKKTNGRVDAAEVDIKTIKATQEATKESLKIYELIGKVLSNKVFWIVAGFVALIILPWVTSHIPSPSALLKLLF